MGAATTALVGLGVLQASMQIASGITRSSEIEAEAKYNAAIYEQKAGMVEAQKNLEAYQYERAIKKARGTAVARTAKAGLLLSGSPLAVMIDTETQMLLDKSIGQYNLEVQKRYALSGAAEYRRKGKISSRTALMTGYTNAFTTLLQTGKGRIPVAPSDYYLRAGRI
jgi:hypothetical protein